MNQRGNNFMNFIKYLSISLILLSSLYSCTDKHEPASCPPDCPDGMKSSSIEETDRYMMGEWDIFLRQISESLGTEMQGIITINSKISTGLYSGVINGKARYMKFDLLDDFDCSTQQDLSISCSDKESIERMDWKVTVGISTDGIELVLGSPRGDISIYMDVHESHIERSLGTKFYTGEETYLMGKIINGKSPLDTMDTRTIKMD